MDFFLAEAALQQALESLAMAGHTPWAKPHGDPADFICSGGVNPPGIEVLAPPKRSVTSPATEQTPPAIGRGRPVFSVRLAEVALQQTLEGLAVAGLVAGQAVRLRRPAAQ